MSMTGYVCGGYVCGSMCGGRYEGLCMWWSNEYVCARVYEGMCLGCICVCEGYECWVYARVGWRWGGGVKSKE